MNWKIFKLGIWICMQGLGIPVSYKTEGQWFSSTEAMDLVSFIEEMCLADEVELSLMPHRLTGKPIKPTYRSVSVPYFEIKDTIVPEWAHRSVERSAAHLAEQIEDRLVERVRNNDS